MNHHSITSIGPLDPERQNALAHAVQAAFPLARDPYAVLGARIGAPGRQVREQLAIWEDAELLREISAVLEGASLGHESALVAGAVGADIDRISAIVNRHPTVTHNYERDHHYNLWFTIAAPAEIGLEPMVAALARQAGVDRFHILRRTHTFKIGVNFDLESRRSVTAAAPVDQPTTVAVDADTVRCYRALQMPLRIEDDPFARPAAAAGVDPDQLLAFAAAQQGKGMRRYVATFHHRRLGVRGNGMVVWRVDEDRLEDRGAALAQVAEVSHCYAREAIAGFPYRLYSMVHGPNQPEVCALTRSIAARIGLDQYLILFSSREFKKCRLRYFLPELDDWWAEHGVAMEVPKCPRLAS